MNQQSEALVRELVAALKSLRAPVADQAFADQLNAAADHIVAKESQLTVAYNDDDDAAIARAEAESKAAWNQFTALTTAYGFVECKELDSGGQP